MYKIHFYHAYPYTESIWRSNCLQWIHGQNLTSSIIMQGLQWNEIAIRKKVSGTAES
jgi:hypothetical protein